MSEDFRLEDYFGVLDDDTADELERIVEARRRERSERHRARVERFRDALSE